MEKLNNLIKHFFKKKLNQNEKLIKNMEEYAKKEKTEQQKSEILGQKPVKRKTNKKESINVRSTS
tara:strand:+ start:745 stop:939 length:195 start_codon:yes stop_codon:yes gene_type:complete